MGGTIPVRFPSQADPGDAGWHIEGSFDQGGQWWVNCRGRLTFPDQPPAGGRPVSMVANRSMP